MRFYLRKLLQGVLFFGFVLFLNVYVPLFYNTNRNSDGPSDTHSNTIESEWLKHKRSLEVNSGVVDNKNNVENKISSQGNNSIGGGQHPGVDHGANEVMPSKGLHPRGKTRDHAQDRDSAPAAGSVGHGNPPKGFNDFYEFDRESDARTTELSDIFISVKTTQKFHQSRLRILLETWVVLAKDETYFFTDAKDEEFSNKTRGHLINTNCSAQHNRESLCCKMSVEYDYFIASKKRWFCHVDDDTYVNIPELSRLLQKYNHTEDWYLGKPSLTHPIEINNPNSPGQRTAFWFATGGAGMCISRALALKMMPYAAGGKLKTQCARIRLPDDCAIGFIIYYELHKELTVVQQFHSHLEGLRLIRAQDLDKQITLSYNLEHRNLVYVEGLTDQDDPSRFHSIHCRLFPYIQGCPGATR